MALRGDEDNRDLRPPAFQFLLKVETGHSGHRDVEEEATCLGGKTALRIKSGSHSHRLVVIDDRHQSSPAHHECLVIGAASVTLSG
jgi:hypothetical protein